MTTSGYLYDDLGVRISTSMLYTGQNSYSLGGLTNVNMSFGNRRNDERNRANQSSAGLIGWILLFVLFAGGFTFLFKFGSVGKLMALALSVVAIGCLIANVFNWFTVNQSRGEFEIEYATFQLIIDGKTVEFEVMKAIPTGDSNYAVSSSFKESARSIAQILSGLVSRRF